MVRGDETGWDVRVDDGVAVVELPRRLALDGAASGRLSDALVGAVSRDDVDRVVTIVNVEHPLSAALHDVVVRGARAAAANGVTDWHVVAEHEAKAVAVAREIHTVETSVFTAEPRAASA